MTESQSQNVKTTIYSSAIATLRHPEADHSLLKELMEDIGSLGLKDHPSGMEFDKLFALIVKKCELTINDTFEIESCLGWIYVEAKIVTPQGCVVSTTRWRLKFNDDYTDLVPSPSFTHRDKDERRAIVRKFRAHGCTQQKIADLIGVSQSMISQDFRYIKANP